METPSRSSTSEKEAEIREAYSTSLQDLSFHNSKLLIEVLTDIADESKEYAHVVVSCIVERLEKVADPLKLPVLYLIDSIIKRVGSEYSELFCKHIPRLFALVYKQGDETIRQKLSKLRGCWGILVPAPVLSQLDRMVQAIDSTWSFSQSSTSIHVNPKFFAIGANVTNANGVTTTRITPVSSELINAAAKLNAEKRARDPRLRRIEQQEQSRPVVVNTNNSAASVTAREAKILPPALSTATTTTISVPHIDAKIDQKNDRRAQLEKRQVPASKIEPKAAPVKKIIKVVKTTGKSSSRSSDSATVATPSTSGTNSTISNSSSSSSNGSIVKVAKSSKVESSTKAKSAGGSVAGATTKTSAAITKTIADTTKAIAATTKPTSAATQPTSAATKRTTASTMNPVKEKGNEIAENIGEMLKYLLNRDKQMERPKLNYFSKEERSHRLRVIAETLIEDPEGDKTLASMAEYYPKIVPILISMMEECKGVSATVSENKESKKVEKPKSKTTLTTSMSSKNSAVKRDKTASPKRASKTASAPAPVTKKTSPVVSSVTTSHIPLPPTTTLVYAVTSTTTTISTPAAISTSTVVEPSPPVAITVPPIMASIPIPIPPVITASIPVATSTTANPVILAATTSIANLADKLIPTTTLQSISVTTSATSTSACSSSPTPSTVSPAKPVSPAQLSPTLPVPPPAPIISSTAAAAEQSKTQDVDYRQLFGFQILPVPTAAAAAAAAPVAVVVPEDESKMVIEVNSEDEEIEEVIDVDALPSKPEEVATTSVTSSPTTTPVSTSSSIKPIKRKSQDNRNYRNHKKRRTSVSSNDSDASSRCSVDSVETSNSNSNSNSGISNNKRPISELAKVGIEEEGSRSPGMEPKKAKSDDSFYSQTDTPNSVSNDEKPTPSNLIIMSVSESSRPKTESPPMFPKFESNFGTSFSAPVGNDYTMNSQLTTPEIPPTDLRFIDQIDMDPVKSINIDGISREIRHYGSTAIVFMNWDDPRDISFFNGVRNIVVDDKFGIPCTLNAPEIETLVYGVKHRFRLGVPTRELYIDGTGYNCYFGGSPIRVRLHGKLNFIRLEGPPPSVNIGTVKRLDVVAGKIKIIIDDQCQYPVYLDAKPQYFFVDRKPVALMFIDGLKRVFINNVAFRTDFGGPSQSFKFLGKVYQFRLTALPKGILPGLNLAQMIVTKLPSPPPLPPQFQFSVSDSLPTPPMPPPVLTTAIPPPAIEQPPQVTNNVPSASSGVGGILENISIDELFQKLVASGIVPNVDNKSEETSDTVKHVDFDKPETLKQRQPALIKMLYSGIQCGSCGLRFPAEQTIKYSQHLDWHFRLNRKGKDGARTIHSRKWYYSKTDWIKFQEMEDTTDRGTSWFDNHPVTEYTEEVLEDVPCIPAGSNQNAACELCRDRFEQFYNDESDEWQLRNAIKVDELIYHPMCYSDHQQKLEQERLEAAEKEKLAEEAEASALAADTTTTTDEKPVEKSDEPSTEPSAIPVSSMDYDDDDDSDVEEVRIIEQPIEEIIINDENDYDEPNLETLNTEDIIAAQQEIAVEELPEDVPKPIKIEDTDDDKIVDISDPAGEPSSCDEYIETVVDSPQTKSGPEGVVNMDGNIELLDNPVQILNTATKIKINISKNITEAHSPRPEEPKNTTNGHDNGAEETVAENSYSIVSSTSDEEKLVPVSVKSRIQDAKLNIYPAVTKGTEKSGLCTIM
ncbi:uncharacterized protein LOC135836194 isoform X2 [Planococcus citri]